MCQSRIGGDVIEFATEEGGTEVGLCEVVQAEDVIEEDVEFRRKVLQHEPVVVGVLQLPHLLLGEGEGVGEGEWKETVIKQLSGRSFKSLFPSPQEFPTWLRRPEGSVGILRSHDQASFLYHPGTRADVSELTASGGQRPALQVSALSSLGAYFPSSLYCEPCWPGAQQLSNHEFHQHVEQGPEIIVPTHLLHKHRASLSAGTQSITERRHTEHH
ncbi:UNVERIFIED_CONTAM: hypothetical protein FKN15_026394 [Acipenser sinensis]